MSPAEHMTDTEALVGTTGELVEAVRALADSVGLGTTCTVFHDGMFYDQAASIPLGLFAIAQSIRELAAAISKEDEARE